VEDLKSLLLDNESWLVERILFYARRQGYTKYTSTLIEAWRLSITGLSWSIVEALDSFGEDVPEFVPDEEFSANPLVAFGMKEAGRHRKRGVNLGMFLGLLKYFRQTYQDLIREKVDDAARGARDGVFIIRCFDLLELAMNTEWNATPADKIHADLQRANRRLTDEKNRYVTLFESLSDPAFLLNGKFLVENYNVAAARLLKVKDTPGGSYYGRQSAVDEISTGEPRGKEAAGGEVLGRRLGEILPWMEDVLKEARRSKEKILRRELEAQIGGETKYVVASLSAMLDVLDVFEGAVIILTDITAQKKMAEKIMKLADTDPLTGVLNRRSFMEKAEAEVARSRRYCYDLAVLMIDIDHFKRINDTHGHHMGDLALKHFAGTCLGILRENDIFSRIGGEEFIALLPEVGEKGAFQVAERLREKISQTPVSEGEVSINLQVSIGVAALQEKDATVEELIRAADQAMYSAKRLGRNRVVSASKKYQPAL
jgi:diguanylate cyclase (GGDEF)-like protein